MYTDWELDSHRPILYESLHYLSGFEASYSVHWLISERLSVGISGFEVSCNIRCARI